MTPNTPPTRTVWKWGQTIWWGGMTLHVTGMWAYSVSTGRCYSSFLTFSLGWPPLNDWDTADTALIINQSINQSTLGWLGFFFWCITPWRQYSIFLIWDLKQIIIIINITLCRPYLRSSGFLKCYRALKCGY